MLSSKRKLFSETSYLGDPSSLGVFPLSILAYFLTRCKAVKQSIHYNSKDSRLPVHYFRILNSENAPKEIMQSFIYLVNLTKWLMDENQQPSVTKELGRLFPSIRGGGSLRREKPQKSTSHKTTSEKTPSKFAILSRIKPSDLRFVTWFMSFIKFDLPQLQVEVFQTKSELF